MFARFFWKKRTFEDLTDVDRQLEWFNESSLRYTNYVCPEKPVNNDNFIPRVYFLRQVQESENSMGVGSILVANEEILLPAVWINFFVLAEWNLTTERLTVSIEQNEQLVKLSENKFPINKTTKKKLKKSGALLSCI
ncbi:MAG: hypothetical protein KAW56_11425 [Candidatus Marinimicrobia bacterium]|nr:hypothetical protein [Candidatus Neomarinimicrobiota bacterium]